MLRNNWINQNLYCFFYIKEVTLAMTNVMIVMVQKKINDYFTLKEHQNIGSATLSAFYC